MNEPIRRRTVFTHPAGRDVGQRAKAHRPLDRVLPPKAPIKKEAPPDPYQDRSRAAAFQNFIGSALRNFAKGPLLRIPGHDLGLVEVMRLEDDGGSRLIFEIDRMQKTESLSSPTLRRIVRQEFERKICGQVLLFFGRVLPFFYEKNPGMRFSLNAVHVRAVPMPGGGYCVGVDIRRAPDEKHPEHLIAALEERFAPSEQPRLIIHRINLRRAA